MTRWKKAVSGVREDIKELGSFGNVLSIILFFLGPAIGVLMNDQRFVVYGIACALTVALWWFAFRLANHISSPTVSPVDSTLTKIDTAAVPEMTTEKLRTSRPKKATQKDTKPDLPVEKLRFTAQAVSSPTEELPFALEITIQTNVVINSPHIRVQCDGPINDGRFRFIGQSALLSVQTQLSGNSFDFSCAFPAFTPQNALIITVLSKQKVNVVRVIHVI